MAEPFDLSEVFIHLGGGSTATPLPDFTWSPEYMAGYHERFAADGTEGRLVCMMAQDKTWDSWERWSCCQGGSTSCRISTVRSMWSPCIPDRR